MRIRYGLTLLCLTLLGLFGLAACTLTEVAPTPYPTPDIPRVRFLFPENSALVFKDSEITVDIFAEDQTAGIARVIFLVDNVQINEGMPPVGSVPEFRVAMNWVAGNLGGHTLHAIAYRADGTQSDEAIILVEVVER